MERIKKKEKKRKKKMERIKKKEKKRKKKSRQKPKKLLNLLFLKIMMRE